MATCSRCHGHLTDHHRCPRRRGRIAAEITLSALAGGLAALLVAALVDAGGQFTYLGPTAVTIGVFGAIGLDKLLRG